MAKLAINKLKEQGHIISLGIYSADLGDLRSASKKIKEWGCKILHFDVMDGVFVPNMSAGSAFVKALDIDLLREVHLMVENPAQHVASYVKAGADIITIHAEANDAAEALKIIRQSSKEAGRPVLSGVGIMPETSLSEIDSLLDLKPDMILVLSLDPRKNTAPNIKAACDRIKELRNRYGHRGPILAFDGGVTIDNIEEITNCQPDIIVSGSAVFGADNPRATFEIMSTI